MPSRDFIPQNREAFAVWFANFILQLGTLAAKYGISAAKVTELTADNAWVQYWIEARNTAKQQERQLSDYVTDTLKGELGDPQPDLPKWTLPPGEPSNVPPGIEKRIREVVSEIKAQKSIFTQGDGELLDILPPEEADKPEADFAAELYDLRALSNYGIEAAFRRYGTDAVRVEVRQKGGGWMPIGFLTKSPGVFNINPQNAGDAELVELRAVSIKDSKPYGSYSPSYTITVAP